MSTIAYELRGYVGSVFSVPPYFSQPLYTLLHDPCNMLRQGSVFTPEIYGIAHKKYPLGCQLSAVRGTEVAAVASLLSSRHSSAFESDPSILLHWKGMVDHATKIQT